MVKFDWWIKHLKTIENSDWIETKDTRKVRKALIRQWRWGKNGYQKIGITQFAADCLWLGSSQIWLQSVKPNWLREWWYPWKFQWKNCFGREKILFSSKNWWKGRNIRGTAGAAELQTCILVEKVRLEEIEDWLTDWLMTDL